MFAASVGCSGDPAQAPRAEPAATAMSASGAAAVGRAPELPPGVGSGAGSAAAPSAPAGNALACRPGGPGVEVAGDDPACWTWDAPADAFDAVLATKPLVLAVGESHAQKGSEDVAPVAVRFTEGFLPKLAGKASDLVLELWVADPKCSKKKVEEVAKKQEPVTSTQSAGNQNAFQKLGAEAKRLGVAPHVLVPSCDEYDAILKAGDDAVLQMLGMITRLTAKKTQDLLAKNARTKMVVAYGGAMHNDLAPREERKAWSFGPELAGATGGRYVELDLVVPEFVRDTESWRALPWWGLWDPAAAPTKATLVRIRKGSFALFFAKSKA